MCIIYLHQISEYWLNIKCKMKCVETVCITFIHYWFRNVDLNWNVELNSFENYICVCITWVNIQANLKHHIMQVLLDLYLWKAEVLVQMLSCVLKCLDVRGKRFELLRKYSVQFDFLFFFALLCRWCIWTKIS